MMREKQKRTLSLCMSLAILTDCESENTKTLKSINLETQSILFTHFMKKQNGKSYYYTDCKTTDAGEPVTFLNDLCLHLGHYFGNGVNSLLHDGVSSYVYIINIFIDDFLNGVTTLPNVDGVTLNQGVHAPCRDVD